ncbi:MAG: DNA polymerase III subunit gamma/tau [Rhodobacteraceae bacterium]|nr:DNA polymerase III subunit gamma/tau [Paracoccaceae bacterium]
MTAAPDAPYTVLARKYRPQTFSELKGQEALRKVLTNAFERDRIAHAFMLTGVRGVGKTTTARIIAKGLNCLGSDKPTIQPCGTCANCVAIAESRHVDVMEMDAASRTGIDDIREIIESVRYRASEARYKVYIIDEVHMLSKNAFNGLLKTLEEPPPHVKFILATTDIHKVPVTVLSRCMRFDLRRVDAETLVQHLTEICDQEENVEAEPAALGIIARVSEGSVRDSLSLLDQAISHGAGVASEQAVRDMLGLAERGKLYELFEQLMKGQAAAGLATLQDLYVSGGDPVSLLREVAEICHFVSVAKVAPAHADNPTTPPAEREKAKQLAEALPVRTLSRAWQMLLKGLEETARAPSALAAAEMVIIRMTHVADLPAPEELMRRLSQESGASAPNGAGRAPGGAPNGGPSSAAPPTSPAASGQRGPEGSSGLRVVASGGGAAQAAPQPSPAPTPTPQPNAATASSPSDFDGLVALIRAKRDAKLLVNVESYVRPGPVQRGAFEFSPVEGAPPDLAAVLGQRLTLWTGSRWIVSIADGHDAPTLAEIRRAKAEDLRARAEAHPLVQAVMATFPGAALETVRDLAGGAADVPALDYGDDSDSLLDEDDDDDVAGLWDGIEPVYDEDDIHRDPL